jgi:pilus assembly protein CpaE
VKIAEGEVEPRDVESAPRGMVVAVYSVKGGSGKTTIAVNLAAALGSNRRGESVLLDLGLPYNHAALIANLVPNGCLATTDRLRDERFEHAVLNVCLHHPSGAMVLPSAIKVEQSELITPQLVQRTLDVLQKNFTFVVVDLGVAMSEVALSVLDRAEKVFMIVTPELPAIKDTDELLRLFDRVLQIPAGKISLVFNHPRPDAMATRADAEKVIRRLMQFDIPYDGARFERATVTGEILVVRTPSSPPAKILQRLAMDVLTQHRMRAMG